MSLKIRPRTIPAHIRTRIEAGQTWTNLLTWMRRHESPRWVFRGQGQKWPLKPAAARGVKTYETARELQLFDEFRRLASPFVDRSAVSTPWDWLFVAQHHGLPTRLLDWTTNPLVAVYFACQPSARSKRDGILYAVEASIVGVLDTAAEADPFGLTRPRFVYPTAVADRITSQRGLFSVHPQPEKNWRLIKGLEKFEIPADHKELIRGYLAGVGVDAAMIMADIDGLASNLCWRYRNGMAIQ